MVFLICLAVFFGQAHDSSATLGSHTAPNYFDDIRIFAASLDALRVTPTFGDDPNYWGGAVKTIVALVSVQVLIRFG